MTLQTGKLEDKLAALSKLKVELKVNQNRSTMIRILERKKRYVKLSIHQMFEQAEHPILSAVVDFIHNKKNKYSSSLLQEYINTQLNQLNYTKKLNKKKLVTLGEHFDLEQIYNKINQEYFDNQLDLKITWYGKKERKRSSQVTFGLYNEPTKLIKINRILDKKSIPDFFIEFVVYHEMLHAIYRPKRSEKGYVQIHTPIFKQNEKKFKYYFEAKLWEKKYRHSFFR